MRQELRELMRQQLVIIRPGQVTASDELFREAVVEMTYPKDSCSEVDGLRRACILKLFNGRWSKHDVVEHEENGCCTSPENTLLLMQTHGVDALWPRALGMIDRKGWTGMEEVSRQTTLPINCHGLLASSTLALLPAALCSQGCL